MTSPRADGWRVLWEEDFEGVFPSAGWTVWDSDGATNGEYLWDDDTFKPHAGLFSAWPADEGADGLDPEFDDYPPNMDSWMRYGPLDLSAYTGAALEFWYWLDSDVGSGDNLSWGASTDEGAYGNGISAGSADWAFKSFDLSDPGNFVGQPSVYIWFRFDSDADSPTGKKGAFVDDIQVVVQGPPGAFGKTWPLPAATVTGLAANLAWEPAEGAADYWYCYDTTDNDSCQGWEYAGDATGALIGPLVPGTTYYWQARASNGEGFTYADGAYGQFWSFTTTPQGVAVGWGQDIEGQVADTPAGNDFVALAAGSWHNLALRADGSLAAWGFDGDGQVSDTPAGNDFVALAAGSFHSLALRADGSIAAWGRDNWGQVANTPAGNDFVALGAGSYHSLALRADGSIAAWGRDDWGQVANTPAGNDFVALAAGSFHNLALRADGSIAAWGDDRYDQVWGTPTGNGFVALAAGSFHSLALRADGSIAAWGDDLDDQVSGTPAGSDFVALAAGNYHNLALRADGSLAAWGFDGDGQVSDTPAGNDFVAVAAGGYHSLALETGEPPAAFGKVSPPNGATGVALDAPIEWENPDPGLVDWLTFCVDTSDDDDCTAWNVGGPSGDATNYVNPFTYEPNTTYYWQARHHNAFGTSHADEGVWWSFTTGDGSPGDFERLSPADGVTNQPLSLTLSWELSAGATSYWYCLDPVDDDNCTTWVDVGDATSAEVSGLAPNTTYYWVVSAHNDDYESNWLYPYWSFTTAPEVIEETFHSVGATDGWVLERDEDSGKGSDVLDGTSTTARVGDNDSNYQYRSILTFDTARLPDDAVVTGITLYIRREKVVGVNPFTIENPNQKKGLNLLKVDMQAGYYHDNPTLEKFDFHAIGVRGNVGRFIKTPADRWYRAPLRAASYGLLNLSGVTQFRLRFDLDDNDNMAADYLSFYTGNAASADRPRLVVGYYVP